MKRKLLGFSFLPLIFAVASYVFTAAFLTGENIVHAVTAPIAGINNEHDDEKPNLRDVRLLIVKTYPDGTLAINRMKISGTEALEKELLRIFEVRAANGIFSDSMKDRDDVPDADRIEKTVWILAAPGVSKEKLNELRGVIKSAGAKPVKMLTARAYRKLLNEPFIDPNEPIV